MKLAFRGSLSLRWLRLLYCRARDLVDDASTDHFSSHHVLLWRWRHKPKHRKLQHLQQTTSGFQLAGTKLDMGTHPSSLELTLQWRCGAHRRPHHVGPAILQQDKYVSVVLVVLSDGVSCLCVSAWLVPKRARVSSALARSLPASASTEMSLSRDLLLLIVNFLLDTREFFQCDLVTDN